MRSSGKEIIAFGELLNMKSLLLAVVLVLTFDGNMLAGDCGRVHAASPPELVKYLNDAVSNQDNAECVATAIAKLGDQRYEPAIPVLLKFLEFRWPLDARGKRNLATRRLGFGERFPAELALEKFGDKVLPVMLQGIKDGQISRFGIESAVAVWMTFYEKDAVTGVALLKHEADKTSGSSRARLVYAAYLAQKMWCDPSLRKQCKAVAATRYLKLQPATKPESASVSTPR